MMIALRPCFGISTTTTQAQMNVRLKVLLASARPGRYKYKLYSSLLQDQPVSTTNTLPTN